MTHWLQLFALPQLSYHMFNILCGPTIQFHEATRILLNDLLDNYLAIYIYRTPKYLKMLLG